MSFKVLMQLKPAGMFAFHYGEGTRADDFPHPARPGLKPEKEQRLLSRFIRESDTVHFAHRVPFSLREAANSESGGSLLNTIRALPLRTLTRLALVKGWSYDDADTYLVATASPGPGLAPADVTSYLPNAWSSPVLTVDSEVTLINYNFRGSGHVTALFANSEDPVPRSEPRAIRAGTANAIDAPRNRIEPARILDQLD